MAVPRLILALLIGFTIARPLEMKIFEKEINVKMTENLHKKIQHNDSLLAIENNNLINTAAAERQRITDRKLAIENQLSNLRSSYVQEADGTGGSGKIGIDKLTHLKMDAYEKQKSQFAAEQPLLDKKIAEQDSILSNAKANMEEKRKEYEKSAAHPLLS